MRTFAIPLLVAASFGLSGPAVAQDLGDMIGGIAQGLIQQELDRTTYIAAQETNTAAAYRNYLMKFPRGQYRTNAERALERLGGPVEGIAVSDAQIEARLSINRAQRIAVQRRLTQLGYSTRGTDGIWGRNTRDAIATWQRDRGEKVTGYVTAAQFSILSKGAAVSPPDTTPTPTTPPGSLSAAQTEATLRLTRSQRTSIQRQLTSIGYDAGVADGLWGSRTRDAIRAWQRANRNDQTGYVTNAQVRLIASQSGERGQLPVAGQEEAAVLEESLLELTVSERSDLQRRLSRLGYATSRTDGTFGAGTRRAIANWQEDTGLTATGYLTADQVRQIRIDTGG
ncbi:MAG: peptidoglycan-binding domain-containing protein [Pseudotabrizicola sp.]|uniref:peptidoglycan-binding domain-containing protein n=1 Tax=Pseudotabrizicola sp. TaxID=2939647 RepID=UPI00272EFA12|nr:peptidoglycan-binding protein [Pseudotabrizicola sp.]MDP2079345.1 peptidoglycan-binding domain-containing protein [Pseudotabrizicola sp.]MDZ7572328.1 peptidoglycan-binding domain-containing protein [Pseudotabrizicola sp.]